jgi:tRNA A-37 threonylcarbamoyl transferase component Bud32/membrane-associated phospholipid phosphatase
MIGGAPVGRRRRPSGEAPPLPRHVATSTRWYLVAVTVTAGLELCLALPVLRRWITDLDTFALRPLAELRTGWLTALLRDVEYLGSVNTVRLLGWTTIAVLLVSRRLRHLLTYLAVLLVVVTMTSALAFWVGRMRPTGVLVIGSWDGYSHPSVPVTALAAVSVGAMYTLIPTGRWRNRAKWVSAGVVGALALSRLYLGVDHPTDVLAALGIGWAMPVIAFRLVVPDEVFAIRYRRGTSAHLDVTGRRGEAIIRALDQQLAIRADSVEPFGQEGSAGSTPLRIRIRRPDGSAGSLFAKLYALNHLRADRSYKLTRMVLYGRLEDEKPFSTVRRLAEYEDHMLRLLRDAGLSTPQPYGFVEITPEREYVIVMSFVEHAREIGAEPLTEEQIDGGLQIVRQLWQAGVAHRDIKPSNLLVAEGQVKLIDVAFATVRPTPWRQAVDLANMMLTLTLASEPELVYQRATRIFAPEDVAEAFAACRGITIPTQLRSRLRRDRRDLVRQFRRLAPDRPPVPIQLWSLRRVAVTMCVAVAALIGLAASYSYVQLAGLL